jgi:hypothetical protein
MRVVMTVDELKHTGFWGEVCSLKNLSEEEGDLDPNEEVSLTDQDLQILDIVIIKL